MTIQVRAEFRARPGRAGDARRVAAELAAVAADEPGTLSYAWFGGASEDTLVAVEEYTDPAAALAHNDHCAALLRRMGDAAVLVSAALHGELDDALTAWVAAHPQATVHPPLPAE